MACRAIKSLAKALEASIWAAAREGPKTAMPAACRASANPAARGTSGPTTTRSICFSLAKATSAGYIVDADGNVFAQPGGAGVAGRDIQFAQLGRLGQLPGNGVFAPTRTNDEHVQASSQMLKIVMLRLVQVNRWLLQNRSWSGRDRISNGIAPGKAGIAVTRYRAQSPPSSRPAKGNAGESAPRCMRSSSTFMLVRDQFFVGAHIHPHKTGMRIGGQVMRT